MIAISLAFISYKNIQARYNERINKNIIQTPNVQQKYLLQFCVQIVLSCPFFWVVFVFLDESFGLKLNSI